MKMLEFAQRHKTIKCPDPVYMEDHLLNHDVITLILSWHGWLFKSCKRHINVNGKEVDAVILAETYSGRERRIGVELKEYDMKKVVEQALQRKKYFHAFYVITRPMLLRGAVLDCYIELDKNGIGYIIVPHEVNIGIMLLPASVNLHPEEIV